MNPITFSNWSLKPRQFYFSGTPTLMLFSALFGRRALQITSYIIPDNLQFPSNYEISAKDYFSYAFLFVWMGEKTRPTMIIFCLMIYPSSKRKKNRTNLCTQPSFLPNNLPFCPRKASWSLFYQHWSLFLATISSFLHFLHDHLDSRKRHL